ncbi:unnamed protein product [Prunus brigantina]
MNIPLTKDVEMFLVSRLLIQICCSEYYGTLSASSYNSIEILTRSNYLKWKEELEISLGLMDYDIALKWDALEEPAANATADVKRRYEKWEKANKMAILIMLRTMTPSLRGSIPRSENAKEFLAAIGLKFKESDKGEKSTLLNKLTEMKYDGRGYVRAHIMNMADVAYKLKELNMTIDEDMMVHFALNSLPKEFKTLKSSYVAQKESWTLDDLITISVQE